MTAVPPTAPDPAAARRRRLGIAAIVALGFAWAFVLQSLGWAQTSYYALVKALGDGTAQIDAYHWETRDKSFTNGHFFSVKAPGLPFLLLPVNEAFEAFGGREWAREAADRARENGAGQWTYRGLNVSSYGYDAERAAAVKRLLETQAPIIWVLTLVGSVLPAVALLLLVRSLAERLQPGLGTATALTLGLGTLVMVFATQLFGHVIASLIGFAAFALLWREREGPPRLGLLALAGVLSGLAVVTEYPLAFAGAIVGLYGVLRPEALAGGLRPVLARGGAYAAGVLAGVLPLAAYNLWAFGSLTTLSYDNAVDRQGFSGHDTLGLNDGGFFGIGLPDARVALELLIAPRGLLVITPVLALGLVGTVLLHRRGRRAEALTIGAVCAVYWVYTMGYWLPFGGGSPGPRFLVPVLPFLALGIAETWRRLPATTLVLGTCGAVVMSVAAITYPLIGTGSVGQWWERLAEGNFQHTIVSIMGAGNGWPALLPVLGLLAAAVLLGVRATGPLPVGRDVRTALAALAGWCLLALVVSPLFGEVKIVGVGATAKGDVDHTGLPWQIVVGAALLALLALGGAAGAERRAARAPTRSGSQVVDDERAAALAAHS